jgi:PilZ domain
MKYQRYFRPEQQLLIKVKTDINQDGRTELMTGYIISAEQDTIIVSLPYGADAVDQYPFREEMPFEITTEALGMGIRAQGHFARKVSGNQIAIQLNSELQMFQRRISERLDCQLGIRFSRAAKTLQTMREIWERNLEVLHGNEAPLIFEGFKPARVNISSGGLRLAIKPPANQGELCLVLVNLEDSKPPVCAIAEIVWSCTQDETAITAGMRFINILSEDQQRIDKFISENKST